MTWYSAFGGAAAALVLVTGVAACGNNTPPIAGIAEAGSDTESLFAQALARPTPGAVAEFDAAELARFLSPLGELTYTAAGADAATGAYRLENVTFVPADVAESVSLTAGEILIWDFDLGAVEARLEGQSLDQTLRVFDRIEFGSLAVSVDVAAATINALPTTAEEFVVGEMPKQDMQVTANRMVLNGLTLHPWLFAPAEDADEDHRAIGLVSAALRSFSLDDFLLMDASIDQTASSDVFSTAAKSGYARQLLRGYDRGNVGAMIQTDATFDMSMTSTDPILSAQFPGIRMSGSTAYAGWTGLKLAPLLEWGERGELPPITELEGWSLGRYVAKDMTFNVDDVPLLAMGKLDLAADQFSWFLPEKIDVAYEGFQFDLAGLMSFAGKIAELSEEPLDNPTPAEVADMLDRAGLAKITSDGVFSFRWDRETGQTLAHGNAQTPGLFNEDWKIDLALPSFAELVPAFGEDGRSPDEDALDQLMKEQFALGGGHWSLADAGGFDAVSRLVIEGAKIGAVDEPMLAGFAESTPEAMRSFAAGGVTVASGEVGKQLPEARDWMMRLSDFINQGGKITVTLAPAEPVTAESLAALDTGGMSESDPSEIIRVLGIGVTHTPPAQP